MSLVFLNGDFVREDKAKISFKDRSVLFGDSIYEVIPATNGRMVGFELHIDRLNRSLREIGMKPRFHYQDWMDICQRLLNENDSNAPIYIQVSRGAPANRGLGYGSVPRTVFAYSLEHLAAKTSEPKSYSTVTARDIRWGRCDIKSTSLLASVMTFNQQTHDQQVDEVLMYNERDELTEGCAVNVFIVKGNIIATPPADHQILAGVTRHIFIESLKKHSTFEVEERPIQMTEVHQADEVMLSSSSKGVSPIVEIDGQPIGTGEAGPVWKQCHALYENKKFDF